MWTKVRPRRKGALAALLFACVGAVASDAAQSATPVLWRDPGSIAQKNLHWGVGGADRQPAPPFTFVKEDLSGTKPKVRVTDANGVMWNVKFAGPQREKNEVNAEVAANRVAWAFGYLVEEDYLVPEGKIESVRNLERADNSIRPDGTFTTARFERRDPNMQRERRRWTLDANPFVGTKELSGFKIVLALVNNWDNKRENLSIIRVTTSDGTLEDWFLVTDGGASFGRMSGPPEWSPAPTRWDVSHYRAQPLVKGAKGETVQLNYVGQVPMDAVPIDHARWFAALASQLRVEQARAAFEAAGATPTEADGFATHLVAKIGELAAAVQSSAP